MKSKLLLFTVSLCLIVSLNACKSKKQAQKSKAATNAITEVKANIIFEKGSSLSSVIKKAKKENKPIFIEFYTDWCFPCKMMEDYVFTDVTVANFFNENYISLKVDGEKGEGPSLIKKFKVTGYPTLLYLNAKGEVIEHITGSITGSQLLSAAQKGVK